MRLMILTAMLLMGCSTMPSTAAKKVLGDDYVAINAIAPSDDTHPAVYIRFSLSKASSSRTGGQTGSGSDVFVTKSGKFAVGPQLITLQDKAGKNVGQLRGITLGSPVGASGLGYSYEMPRTFTWTIK